jgi:hypothetical protein
VLDIFMLRFVFVVTVFISNISYALSDGRAPMPLPESRAEIYAYYKLGWLADGYPGKYTDNGLVAHPIYGTYVIYDYLREYKRTADSRYLDAAASVARAGASRMEDVGDALVFYYRPESGLTPLPDKFYSALTQSRWLDAFSKIYELNGDLYFRDMANKVFLSLSIPVDQGGVLKEVQGGVSIEEYPHKVPLYTLNGWLTALNIIIEYADRSGNLNARGLIDGNLHALRKMLPLYDLPALSNSRYQLANVAKIKFTGVKVVDVKVEIPGEGVFPLDDVQGVGRQWSNYLYPLSGAQGLHAVLGYVSAPQPNVLHITTASDGVLNVDMGGSSYNPLVTSLAVRQWDRVGSFSVVGNKVAVSLPWSKAYLVAYPTAFTKKIGDKKYNVYHFIHINELMKLYRYTGDDVFKEYAERWRGYVASWKSIDAYRVPGVSLEPYRP